MLTSRSDAKTFLVLPATCKPLPNCVPPLALPSPAYFIFPGLSHPLTSSICLSEGLPPGPGRIYPTGLCALLTCAFLKGSPAPSSVPLGVMNE